MTQEATTMATETPTPAKTPERRAKRGTAPRRKRREKTTATPEQAHLLGVIASTPPRRNRARTQNGKTKK